MLVNGIVESMDIRSVTTKFGVRPTYNITVGGQKFELGFAKHAATPGSEVKFDYATTKFGNEVTKGSLVVVGSVVPVVTGAIVPMVVHDVPKSAKNYGERKFPIDALSPERAIIRQNALTQARELVVGIIGVCDTKDKEWTSRQGQLDSLVQEIIRQAKKFEAYSAGDTDVEEAKAEIKAAKGK